MDPEREIGYRCGHTMVHPTGQKHTFSPHGVCRECLVENGGEEPPEARYDVGDRVCCGGGDCTIVNFLWETKIGWMYVLEQCYDGELYENGQWICENDVMKGGRRPRRYRWN